jgi:2-oxoglutarate dehydrogenase E2 component (dihydrolipoamide succinyltransferase)
MPDLVVPALGESITEAVISRWHKNVGDPVAADEPVVALETDKITVDLPAPAAGALAEQRFAEGATVRVGDVVGTISAGAEAGEGDGKKAAPAEKPAAKPEPADKPAAKPEPADKPAAKPAAKAAPAEKPAARPASKAEASSADRDNGEARGPGGRRLSPSMRRAQREETMPPPVAVDPRASASTPTAAATPVPAPSTPATAKAPAPTRAPAADARGGKREEVVAMTPIRKRIAQRLLEAQQSAATLTTFNEVDMTRIIDLRERFKQEFAEKHGVKLGFMSFFAKAAIAALELYPGLNAEVRDDSIVYKKHYDLGVAVSTERGLIVPVLRDADRLSFAQIEQGIAELATRARNGKLGLDDLVGGTFSITNGGIYGSMMSTPMLNYPQTGILGMHNIVERPVAVKGQVQVRPIMYVALTYDHRVVDGREAVSFLVAIKQRIEDPDRLMFAL